MFKLKYFVILIMVGCLVGMVSAETATSGDTDGSSAWSSSVAYDIDAGTYSVSTATVEDAAAAPAVTTTASEVGGEATTASVDATNADSATMTSAASDGLASSSSEFVATGVDGDKITVAGADQTTGITAAGTSYARQDGTVTSTGTAVVAAASDATAADGATAGTGVVAATEDGTIVLNSQYARGVAEARAGQRVSAFGDDISISAGTYADDGASTSAGVFTSADLSGTASLTIAQRAVADPDAGGDSIARQRLTNGHGTGTVIAGAYSEGASSFSGALAVVNADDGNSMVINHINQRVETDATNSYATNDGLIWEAGTGDIGVLAGTIEGTDNGITGNFVAADGFLVDFDQHSQTTTDVDTIGAHSQQNTAFVDAAGIIGSIAVNDEGSIAGTIAGTNDGSVHTNQVARLTATGVAASQIGNVNTPDGTGIMATAGMSGEGPNAYAYTIAGVTDGTINPAIQTVVVSGEDVTATNIHADVNGDLAWTANGAGDRFGNFANIGTTVVDGSLVASGHAFVDTDARLIHASEDSNTDNGNNGVTFWADGKAGRHTYDEDSYSYTGFGINSGSVNSWVGHHGSVVIDI